MGLFVGFYWTFPVRWINFVDLPDDAEGAAKLSQTVAYQRALVRRHVEYEKGKLLHEVVTIEVSPDRGTSAIKDYIARAGRLCLKEKSTLLYVDFKLRGGWRSHPTLAASVADLQDAGIPSLALPADKILLDGRSFDPADHFSKWRSKDEEARERRRYIVPEALAAALAEVPQGRGRWAIVANLLNKRDISTQNGGGLPPEKWSSLMYGFAP